MVGELFMICQKNGFSVITTQPLHIFGSYLVLIIAEWFQDDPENFNFISSPVTEIYPLLCIKPSSLEFDLVSTLEYFNAYVNWPDL